MEGVVIHIGWEYFLGIMGSLILFAWYSNGRFTRVETNIENVILSVTNLEGRLDNAFQHASPVKLLPKGEEILVESGLKTFIDENAEKLMNQCKTENKLPMNNPYDIQGSAFHFISNYKFDQEQEDKLKTSAFNSGVTLDVVKRIGGIYFRDYCLEKHGYKIEDLDNPHVNIVQ